MTIGRVGVWVWSPTKLKKKKINKPKAEQETAQPTAARFKKKKKNRLPNINRPAYGCAVKNKPRVKLDPRTPAAARLKINRRQSKKPPSLRLRGLKRTWRRIQLQCQMEGYNTKEKPQESLYLNGIFV